MATLVDITSDQVFSDTVEKQGALVIIDFWAEWCGPCRMVAPLFEELANEYGEKITFAKCDTDNVPSIPAKFGVQSIPTMIFFKDGKEVMRLIGARRKDDYITQIKSLLA